MAHMGLDMRKPIFGNQGADQPVHLHSLISTFVNCLLECTISRPAMSEILIVSVAEQAGLNLTSIGNHEDRFSCYEAHMMLYEC